MSMVKSKQDDAESWRRVMSSRLTDAPIRPTSFFLVARRGWSRQSEWSKAYVKSVPIGKKLLPVQVHDSCFVNCGERIAVFRNIHGSRLSSVKATWKRKPMKALDEHQRLVATSLFARTLNDAVGRIGNRVGRGEPFMPHRDGCQQPGCKKKLLAAGTPS